MYAIDFEYDGRRLSSYGFIIGSFNGASGIETVETGFKMTFNKVKRDHGRRYGLTSVQYEECLTGTIQICKNPESGEPYITYDEYRDLVRWLSRREFLKFRLIDPCAGERRVCWYNASFNIKKVLMSDKLCGLELEMETDSPFGYGDTVTGTFELDAGESAVVTDTSDEIGYIRPDLVITCADSGDLTISNALTGSTMTIKNCEDGEVIHVYGDTMILESSVDTHKLYDDFNYDFLTIGNTFRDRTNEITASMACEIELSYAPIIKDSASGEGFAPLDTIDPSHEDDGQLTPAAGMRF